MLQKETGKHDALKGKHTGANFLCSKRKQLNSDNTIKLKRAKASKQNTQTEQGIRIRVPFKLTRVHLNIIN